MNHLEIPLNKYNCSVCKKEYTRKSSLDKHRLLCDYKTKTKIELTVEEEEIGDKPSYDQLVKIVQELSTKYAKMETKVDEMQQCINRRKKKTRCSWVAERKRKCNYWILRMDYNDYSCRSETF